MLPQPMHSNKCMFRAQGLMYGTAQDVPRNDLWTSAINGTSKSLRMSVRGARE